MSFYALQPIATALLAAAALGARVSAEEAGLGAAIIAGLLLVAVGQSQLATCTWCRNCSPGAPPAVHVPPRAALEPAGAQTLPGADVELRETPSDDVERHGGSSVCGITVEPNFGKRMSERAPPI